MAGATARRMARREAIRRLVAAAAGAAALGAATASAAAGATITTVAGGGSATGDGVPALSASLDLPIGVGASANGFLVAEQARHRIRKVTAGGSPLTDTGTIATVAGTGAFGGGSPVLGGSGTAVALQAPCCIASTAAGALLVADTLGGMVHRLTGTRLDTVAGTGAPSSCAAAAPSGVAATTAQLCFVVGIGAHPAEGRFLIAEDGLPDQERNGGARVYEVDAGGTLRVAAGGGCPSPPPSPGPLQLCLANPRGPIFTGSGTEFLVADRARHVVWRISSTGAGATAARIAGTGAIPGAGSELGDGGAASEASLAAPSDLAMLPSGGYLIADRDHCRIRRVAGTSAASTITTAAGTVCDAGAPTADGAAASAAVLHRPRGVTFTPGGVLVSDSGAGRVRLVERTTLSDGPDAIVTAPEATFTFASSEPGPEFLCALDGAAPAPCTSPATYTGLGDGEHVFEVHDGRVPPDPTPARHAWVVDTAAPRELRRLAPADGAVDQPPRPVFEWEDAGDGASGIARYELWIDGRVEREVAPAECGAGTCRAEPAAALSEARHDWFVRAVDRAGHERVTDTGSLEVGEAPRAQLVVAPNPVLVGFEAVLDAGASTDANGPLARFEWDLDGDGRYERDSGAAPATTMRFPVPGTVRVGVRVTDGAGRTAVAADVVRVVEPPGPAARLGVSIDAGAAYTNSRDVTLALSHPDSTTAIEVSNDGGFLAGVTFAPTRSVAWRLAYTGADRLPKTVYVRFHSGPFVSQPYTDDIVLDQSRPEIASATLVTGRNTSTAAASSRRGYLLRTRASDRGSGIHRMQITTDRARPGRLRRYAPRLRVRAARGRIWVRVADRAGNRSGWRVARAGSGRSPR